MKEKKYTLEAWEIAYEAVEQAITWEKSEWVNGEYKENSKTDFTEDEKMKIKCFENVLKTIEKMA